MLEMLFCHPKIERWRAEVHRRSSGGLYVITVNTFLAWNDCPIRVDGRVLYEYPERIPAYAKVLTVKAFDWLDANRKELEK